MKWLPQVELPQFDLTSQQWMLLSCASLWLGAVAISPFLATLKLPSFRMRRKSGIRIGGAWISDEARLRHTHVVGATGSGKTVLLEQLIFADLARGQGAIIIDPKGDRELYERLKRYCQSIGRSSDLHLLSATHHDESATWNPCRLGTASELQTKFFNSAVYSEPHYAKACELGLLKAANRLIDVLAEGFTLQDLVQELEILATGGPGGRDQTLEGLFLDLNNLVLSSWGKILGCEEGRREVSILDVIRKNEILFVDLPTEAQAVQSSRVGRLLLQEIILVSGLRKLFPHLKGDRPFGVYVDEFDAFATEAFATFLNKGRSSNFMIHLAHQTLSDLERVGPTFAGQVLGNANVRFIFRQDSPDDAETWARFFGTKLSIKQTFQTQDGSRTGMSSNREVLEFRVTPDAIKDLRTGQCVFSIKTEGTVRRLGVPFGREASLRKLPVERPALVQPAKPSVADRLTELCDRIQPKSKKENLL